MKGLGWPYLFDERGEGEGGKKTLIPERWGGFKFSALSWRFLSQKEGGRGKSNILIRKILAMLGIKRTASQIYFSEKKGGGEERAICSVVTVEGGRLKFLVSSRIRKTSQEFGQGMEKKREKGRREETPQL